MDRSLPQRRWTAWAACLALCACASCKSVTLDLSAIEEPVLLGPVPVLRGRAGDDRGQSVGVYEAQVLTSQLATSQGSRITTVNTAQTAAFEAVGGHGNRAITGLHVHASSRSANALLVLYGEAAMTLKGSVTEYAGLAARRQP